MNVFADAVTVKMRHLICGECGTPFAAPEMMMDQRERAGGSWYCPNGHPRIYSKTREQQLQEELAKEMRQRSVAEQLQREAEATLKKMEKRIAYGVCPCCRRSFTNVQRHMRLKHPDFVGIAS